MKTYTHTHTHTHTRRLLLHTYFKQIWTRTNIYIRTHRLTQIHVHEGIPTQSSLYPETLRQRTVLTQSRCRTETLLIWLLMSAIDRYCVNFLKIILALCIGWGGSVLCQFVQTISSPSCFSVFQISFNIFHFVQYVFNTYSLRML